MSGPQLSEDDHPQRDEDDPQTDVNGANLGTPSGRISASLKELSEAIGLEDALHLVYGNIRRPMEGCGSTKDQHHQREPEGDLGSPSAPSLHHRLGDWPTTPRR